MFYVTRGLPASGKSTWAMSHDFRQDGTNGVLLAERDMLRVELGIVAPGTKGVGSQEEEANLTKIQHDRIRQGLRLGLTVIVSDTNLPDKRVRDLIGIAEDEGSEWKIKDFRDIDLMTILKRNAVREAGVPEDVIRNMHSRFVKGRDLTHIPTAFNLQKESFDFTKVEKYVANPDGTATILVDVDGTLANHEGVRSPYDVTKYREDTVHEDTAHIVRHLHEAGDYIVVFSGRHKDHKDDLVWWLDEHNIPYDEIVMRERAKVSDDLEKLYLFEKYMRNRDDLKIIAALDDRSRVVNNTWRTALGIRCYQVAPGDF